MQEDKGGEEGSAPEGEEGPPPWRVVVLGKDSMLDEDDEYSLEDDSCVPPNPQPEARNLRPSTLNHTSSTLNPNPSALPPQPQTRKQLFDPEALLRAAGAKGVCFAVEHPDKHRHVPFPLPTHVSGVQGYLTYKKMHPPRILP